MKTRTKKCAICFRHKSEAEYLPTNKATKDGLMSACKDCYAIMPNKFIPDTSHDAPPPAEKTCSCCRITKPGTAFSRCRMFRDGMDYVCRDCKKIKYQNSRKRTERESRDHNLWVNYRIRLADWETLAARQDHKCALCQEDLATVRGKGSPSVDHDHKTGRIRGIICTNCNFALGYIERMGDGALERIAKYVSFPSLANSTN